MSDDITPIMPPKVAGVHAGYYHKGGLPDCPYPLYEGRGRGKVRHPDRAAWFDGFRLGRHLGEAHHAELETLVLKVQT